VIEKTIALARKNITSLSSSIPSHRIFSSTRDRQYSNQTVRKLKIALGAHLDSDEEVERAGHALLDRLNAENVLSHSEKKA